MAVFKQLIEAIFTDLELNEMHLLNQNLGNPTANVEIRLQNQRKGYQDMTNAMRMCCEPEVTAQMPPEEYGAGEEASRMMSESGWSPVEL